MFMPETCIAGQNRFAWPLKQIEQLWQGQGPKFAFYSASPLHASLHNPMVSNSENGIPTHKRAALEAYDATLSGFLATFLHRHPNTLILLRGQQSGISSLGPKRWSLTCKWSTGCHGVASLCPLGSSPTLAAFAQMLSVF